MRGEFSEGGECQGVYSSENIARTNALRLMEEERVRPNKQWEELTHNNWERGCDYYSIQSWSIDEPLTETIYLILRGEAYEGSNCEEVCATEESARAVVARLIEESGIRPNKQWVETHRNTWVRGCDILSIDSWPFN